MLSDRKWEVAMKLVFEGATASPGSVWLLRVQPQELKLLGPPMHQSGKRSLLLVADPSFDPRGNRLEFDATRVIVINLGASTETIVVDVGSSTSTAETNPGKPVFGPGDRALVRMIEAEVPRLKDIAEALLENIRHQFPGDLRECKRRLYN
jgi:hypothetical protein